MVTVVALKLLAWIIGIVPELNFDDLPEYVTLSSTLNIFAWANYLLPVNMMEVLLALTAIYYGAKFIVNIIKFIFNHS